MDFLQFLDSIDPPCNQVPSMDLDESEDEVEVEEDCYAEMEEEENEEEKDEPVPIVPLQMISAGSISLPPPPEFDPFQHRSPNHSRQTHLQSHFFDERHLQSSRFDANQLCPSSFFKLFFTREEFEILATNTNAYAASKRAGQDGRQPWRPTSGAELIVFVDLLIYLGFHKVMQISLCWNHDGEFPLHEIAHWVFQNSFSLESHLEGFQQINLTYARSLQERYNPVPTGNGPFCPGAISKGKNSQSRRYGYVGKTFQLSAK